MNTVLGLIILIAQNNLEKGISYNLANYIIDHLDAINEMSMQELSKNCYISTSSIIKFCRMLGFSSYNDLKKQLQSTIQTRKLQLDEKQAMLTVDDLIEHMQHLSPDKILIKDKIDQIVEIIHETKKIYIYGAVFPVMLTQPFCEDMTIMNVPVHLEHISYNPLEIEQKDGMVLIISISGRFVETHQNEYHRICKLNSNTVLISQDINHLDDLKLNIEVPKTISCEYDDLLVLLILDLIKHCYYKKYYQL
ncbi:hypothetical protein [Thomasclavelia sp.]|uniref:MurR/RpiR family transcriptional regulator n=1 Tax=Thomasclavelia sp. TaxID=3025757 RepID=UPI0025F1AD07|nr:hypothetical protein [Thomasclavelia sp.]